MDVNDAVVVIKRLLTPFRACYYHTLSRDACEEGSLRLHIDLDCDGGVSSIRAEVRRLSSETVQCVMDVASQARFVPPSGGSAQLELPISFRRP